MCVCNLIEKNYLSMEDSMVEPLVSSCNVAHMPLDCDKLEVLIISCIIGIKN